MDAERLAVREAAQALVRRRWGTTRVDTLVGELESRSALGEVRAEHRARLQVLATAPARPAATEER
jgi:hypothetical protein